MNTNVTFSRAKMLKNYADTLIIPALDDLQNKTDKLYECTLIFTNNLNTANHISLKNALAEALTAYQSTSWLNFGPGETNIGLFSENIGWYPVNTTLIGDNINKSDTAFTKNFKRDSRGIYALEYLIYQYDGIDFAVAFINPKNLQYINAVAYHMKALVQKQCREWKTYQATFIANDGTDASSSISYLFNENIADYEKLKNYKIQYPMGKRAGQTKAEPQDVEAYYSGLSVKLLKAHYIHVENRWYGNTSTHTNGTGFDDYLANVEGGTSLINDTKAQFEVVKNILQKIPDDKKLSDLIVEKNPDLEILYTESAKLTRYIKSELSSKLGISITYSSGDGD
ncbi:MAG: imelysin family protein [Cytophagales bacterium]|nr:imelysin family protein [Cytophagales bacterium]